MAATEQASSRGDVGDARPGGADAKRALTVLGVRARARAETTAELLAIARRHLKQMGASSLSLRAVARDAGMVSSAIYRYFPSRDDLLTRLIVDAFDSVGDAVELAERGVARNDLLGRWRAAAHAIRAWALAHPHEYALVFGSPVPGYIAPDDTVGPATRVPVVLAGILRDAALVTTDDIPELSDALRRELVDLAATVGMTATDQTAERMVRGLMAWTHLFGAISFELFGHRHNVIADTEAFYAVEVDRLGMQVLGISAAESATAAMAFRRGHRSGRSPNRSGRSGST